MQEGTFMFASASNSVKIWNEHVTTLRQFNGVKSSTSSNFKDLSWNWNNTLLASASTGSGILLYNLLDTNDVKELSKSSDQSSVCFSSNDNTLFSGGTMGDISQWNCQTGKKVKTFNGGHQSPVKRLDILNNDKVVSACASGEIFIWSIESGNPDINLKGSKPQSIRGLKCSPWEESCLGSTSDDGAICLWDTEKQATKVVFTLHEAPAMDLSFSPLNHLLLASCGLDKKVILYDIQGNCVVKTITANQPLTAVCILENGRHVCAGTSMGNIYKYDLRKAGEPLNSVHAHSTSVQRLILKKIKCKTQRKNSRPSRSNSTNTSNSRDEPQSVRAEEKKRNGSMSSQELAKNSRSLSKIPDVELPPKPTTGDEYLTPAKSIPSRRSQLEKSVGLQTPLNKSVASSRRDTVGSYCEGIFSPVANLADSPQLESASTQNHLSKPQRISKGDENAFSSFNYGTPARQNSSLLLKEESNSVNGITTPRTEKIVAIDSISEDITRRSSEVQPSSPDTDITTEKITQQARHNPVDKLINGNMAGSIEVNNRENSLFLQSNPSNQLDFLKNTVRELVEDHEDNMRDELRHLHMQIIKMFMDQNERIKQLAEQCSVNPLLVQEIERLRIENDRLRRRY